MVRFVSAYVERDKKILKNLFFAFAPYAFGRTSPVEVREIAYSG